MNFAELLLWSAPVLGLAIGLALYVRHGHRRLYRELRQLREVTGPTARQQSIEEVRVRLQALESQAEASNARLELQLQALAHLAPRLDSLPSALAQGWERGLADLESALGAQLQTLVASGERLHAAQDAVGAKLTQASQTSNGLLTDLVARQPPPADNVLRLLQRLQIDMEFVKNRMSSYLGEGMGLTHLVDETPIYLNTADIGCPANFINGGRYEEEYLQVLASFCRPDTVFLDIGANLGVFSLRLAPYVREGRIIAFEPNARIRDLFGRSVHLNGLRERVEIHECGASDETADLVLEVPQGHAGGGHVERALPGDTREHIRVRPLDEVLHDLPAFHLAKIDVEGHELHALRGMHALLTRSPEAVVLFEKLIAQSGLEAPMLELFAEKGMRVWRIEGVRLEPVDLAGFEKSCAYFLAARPETVGQELDRSFFRIRAGHLFRPQAQEQRGLLVASEGPHADGSLLFHGPYWYLPRGAYRVQVEGKLRQPLRIQVAEKFGHGVAQAVLDARTAAFDFIADRDLTHFELVGRAAGEDPDFEIESLRVSRIG